MTAPAPRVVALHPCPWRTQSGLVVGRIDGNQLAVDYCELWEIATNEKIVRLRTQYIVPAPGAFL